MDKVLSEIDLAKNTDLVGVTVSQIQSVADLSDH